MPIPSPTIGEKRDPFISRCMGNEMMVGEYEDNAQRAAVCHSAWREVHGGKREISDELLTAVSFRREKRTEFGYGILTADQYVKTIRDCVGLELCQRYLCSRQASFHDLLQKAARTLVYSNPDMVLEGRGIYEDPIKNIIQKQYGGVELPKNTLMTFRHVLTTPRKDRDGDILRTQGAEVDPKLPLLWQHVHTLPIGKMLEVVEHNSKKLSLISAIIDINELAHDSAVMIDNGMGRFSHGFRALEFLEIKAGKDEIQGGFDVTKFEIMEESLVSIPSNVDADTEEILLSLVEGGKLASPLLKGYGKTIRSGRPIRVPVQVDLELVMSQTLRGEDHADKTKDEIVGAATGGPGEEECSCASEKAKADPTEAEDSGDEKMMCPKCGAKLNDSGLCEECGYQTKEEEKAARGVKGDENLLMDMHDPWGFCPRCGTPYEMDNATCTKCGYPRNTSAGKSVKANGMQVNGKGMSRASGLVKTKKVKRPNGWSPPSAGSENHYIEKNSVIDFGSWHLGTRPGVDLQTKGAYAFIFTSDFETIDRSGLIAIRQRAGQQDYQSIFDAAGRLLEIVDEDEDKQVVELNEKLMDTKAGRVLSKSNESRIRNAKECVDEAYKMEVPRACKSLLKESSGDLEGVLGSLGQEEGADVITGVLSSQRLVTATDAMGIVLAQATPQQRKHMTAALLAMESLEQSNKLVKDYHSLLGVS